MEFSRQSTVGLSKFKIPSVNESRVGLSPKSSVPSTEVQVDVPSSIRNLDFANSLKQYQSG